MALNNYVIILYYFIIYDETTFKLFLNVFAVLLNESTVFFIECVNYQTNKNQKEFVYLCGV